MTKQELVRSLKQSVFDAAKEIEDMPVHPSETGSMHDVMGDIAQDMRNSIEDAGDDLMDVAGVLADVMGDKRETTLVILEILLRGVEEMDDNDVASILAMVD